MKIFKKTLAVFAALSLSASVFAFDWTSIGAIEEYNAQCETISNGLDDFTTQLSFAIPQAASQQNVWADAYIGKLFPSVPPHLGGGFNVGFTRIDTTGLKEAASVLNITGIEDSYYYPVFTADLRIGGLFLPFDLDVAVMKTGQLDMNAMGADLSVDFFTVGAEARLPIWEGNLIFPKLSLGFGYFYNQGSLKAAAGGYANTKIDYKIHTMYASAQLSKTILFLTPFVGVRGFVSKYDNDWAWEIQNSAAVNVINGVGGQTSFSKNLSSDKFDFNAIQPQLFLGCGFRFIVIDFTVSVSADLRHLSDNGLWSGAASLRVSL